MILGLYKSVLGLAIITASTLAASAERSNAPIFPGFSGASATNTNGALVSNCSDVSSCDFDFATAIIPSVVSQYANFSYTSFEISMTLSGLIEKLLNLSSENNSG